MGLYTSPHLVRLGERVQVDRVPLSEAEIAAYAAELRPALEPWLLSPIEHVGSTSVPGLAAKPVIDLMASVGDLGTTVDQAGELLARDGWCYVPPELDQRPDRRFVVKPDPAGQHRLAHLHVLRAGHPRWAEQLAFRDALRGDAQRG